MKELGRWWGVWLCVGVVLWGCEREDDTPEVDEALLSACYHFQMEGAFEYEATCEGYRVTPSSERFLRVMLMHPPVALALEIPKDAPAAQYEIGSPGVEGEAVGAYVLVTPLEGPEQRFDEEVQGTLTVMRLDDGGISALFDFVASSPDGERPVSVRGHLRDLAP